MKRNAIATNYETQQTQQTKELKVKTLIESKLQTVHKAHKRFCVTYLYIINII